MKLKEGVKVSGVQPEIILALMVIQPLFDAIDVDFVITSCRDGKHSKNSKHYLGYAVDIRSREMDHLEQVALAQAIRKALTPEYYLLIEADHFHLQFNGSAL